MTINFGPSASGFTNIAGPLAARDQAGARLLFEGLGNLGRQLQQDRQTREAPQRAAEQFQLLAAAGREAEKQRLIGLGMSEEQANQQILLGSKAQLDRFMAQTDFFQAQAGSVRGAEGRAGELFPSQKRGAEAQADVAEAGAILTGEELTGEAQLARSLLKQKNIAEIEEMLDPKMRGLIRKVRESELAQRGAQAETGAKTAAAQGRVTEDVVTAGAEATRAQADILKEQASQQKIRSEFFEEMEEAKLLRIGDEGALLNTQLRLAEQQLSQNEQIFAERLENLRKAPDPRASKAAELFIAAAGPEGRRIDTQIRAASQRVSDLVKALDSRGLSPTVKEELQDALKRANTDLATAMGQKNKFVDQALGQIERITAGGGTVIPTGTDALDVDQGLERLGG